MRLVPVVISAILGSLLPLSAQQGPSPLVGKTVQVYNPVPGDTLYVDMSGTGFPMKAAPGNWLTYTIPATIQFHITEFGIRNSYGQNNFWLTRTGVGTAGADVFGVADFAGGDSLWIIIDPSGPASAPPYLLTQAPRSIHILNPWEATGPALVLPGGAERMMRSLSGYCGWFTVFLFRPAEMQVYFKEIGGADSYGMGGLGARTPYDLAGLFAAHPSASALWLDTEGNAWTSAFPGKFGYCQYLLATTVRDFSRGHPDFEFSGLSGGAFAPGRIESAIGAGRKPVRSGAPPTVGTLNIFNRFESWWKADSLHADTALRSYETCVDIPMAKTDDGLWEYDSWKTPERGFYPIDDFNRHNEKTQTCVVAPNGIYYQQTGLHNLNFCMESHATFIYRKGQRFEFRGDDDIWVFLNDKLVIDLGGLHEPMSGTVDLDTLGLTEGREYRWDMFLCDRQPCTSSLRFKTSIFFKQPKALEAVADPARPGAFALVRREGGQGSCHGTAKEVAAADLAYQLWSAAGEVLDTLSEGSHFGGGIVIATPSVSVDAAKLAAALPRGAYRLAAFDPANPSVQVEIPFKVLQPSTGLRLGVKAGPRTKKSPRHDALGRTRPGIAPRKIFRKP